MPNSHYREPGHLTQRQTSETRNHPRHRTPHRRHHPPKRTRHQTRQTTRPPQHPRTRIRRRTRHTRRRIIHNMASMRNGHGTTMTDEEIQTLTDKLITGFAVVPPVLADLIKQSTFGIEYRVRHIIPLGMGHGIVTDYRLRPNGSITVRWETLASEILWEMNYAPREG